MKRFVPPPPEVVKMLREEAERELSPEEYARACERGMSPEEEEEALALFDWFTRRYPTPMERVAWGRRAYYAARRRMPDGG